MQNGIAFLGKKIFDNHDKYDNIARNMNHFVFEKTQQEANKKVEQEETVDYFKD